METGGLERFFLGIGEAEADRRELCAGGSGVSRDLELLVGSIRSQGRLFA
jgi:hypothetical protein